MSHCHYCTLTVAVSFTGPGNRFAAGHAQAAAQLNSSLRCHLLYYSIYVWSRHACALCVPVLCASHSASTM